MCGKGEEALRRRGRRSYGEGGGRRSRVQEEVAKFSLVASLVSLVASLRRRGRAKVPRARRGSQV